MLKIRDNVDLKELEKFGFKKGKIYCFYYYSKELYEDWVKIAICKPLQDFKDKQIFLDCIEDETYIYLDEYSEILFDLIQAGLVEKVVE